MVHALQQCNLQTVFKFCLYMLGIVALDFAVRTAREFTWPEPREELKWIKDAKWEPAPLLTRAMRFPFGMCANLSEPSLKNIIPCEQPFAWEELGVDERVEQVSTEELAALAPGGKCEDNKGGDPRCCIGAISANGGHNDGASSKICQRNIKRGNPSTGREFSGSKSGLVCSICRMLRRSCPRGPKCSSWGIASCANYGMRWCATFLALGGSIWVWRRATSGHDFSQLGILLLVRQTCST